MTKGKKDENVDVWLETCEVDIHRANSCLLKKSPRLAGKYDIKVLGMNMAVYRRGDACVESVDFTDTATINFEPVSAFMGDNE